MVHQERTFRQRERGQSLVETALLLPILLLIIAGLVEISNLLIAQSRTDTAARIGARFGANGGEPDGIRIAALNALTQTMELDEARWDIWVFQGTINDIGTAFTNETWSWDHVYGLGQTNDYTQTNEITIQQRVLDRLRTQGDQNAADLKVIGILMLHDVETILGLENYIQGMNTVRGFAVMEVAPVATAKATEGCSAFPIIVEYGQRSVSDSTYNGVTNWQFPATPPQLGSFLGHLPDMPLDEAPEGSVFYFRAPSNYPLGGLTTNFDWLAWNSDENPASDLDQLLASLAWPGNSISADPDIAYDDPATGQPGLHALNPAEPTTYDLVSRAPVTVNSANVGTIMQEHVTRRRGIRLVVWERDLAGGGFDAAFSAYKIRGFVVGRIVGYQLSPTEGTHWLMVELIRWETSCGQRVLDISS